MNFINSHIASPAPTDVAITSQNQWPDDFWPMLFDQLPYIMVIFNREGHLMLANDEAARRLNLSDADHFVLPESLKPLRAGAYELEMRGSRSRVVNMPSPADGNPLSFCLRHLPYGDGLILATGQPGREAPGSLDETAALASEVSRNVGGPLAGIELYASIVGQELEAAGDSALADLIEQIRFGVREVNEYLTSFASMAKPLELHLERHRLSDIVDEALEAMNGVFKERNIGILVTQKDLSLDVDRGLMVQLFLNLLLNAVEAVGQNGRIFVEFEVTRDGQVEVVITDTGPGVPLSDMKKVFSPFHTSKNQALGLGLPVSQRIAEAHQGRLIVGQDLNMGARAVVTLPNMPAAPVTSLN